MKFYEQLVVWLLGGLAVLVLFLIVSDVLASWFAPLNSVVAGG